MNTRTMRARFDEIRTELRTIADENETFDDETQKRWDDLEAEASKLVESIKGAEERAAKLADLDTAVEDETTSLRNKGVQTRVKDDPYNLDSLRWDTSAHDLRERAATGIEQDPFVPDTIKEELTHTLRSVDRRGELAQLMLCTGSMAYRTAWAKVVSGAHWALDDQERAAMTRAQSTSDGAGGYAVPFTLDPTLIITNNGTINPMRQLASVTSITTGDWNGVTSAGATANWRGEAVEATDNAFTLAQPNVPVYKMDLFVPYSIEIEMDWAQMESEIRKAFVDAKDRLEATAHISGSGSGQPTGLVTALDGTSSEIAPATGETFAQEDVYNLRRQVPARFRPNTKWIANIGTYDAIRGFDTQGGGGFWTDMMDGTPDKLLGYPTYEASDMDDAADIDTGADADNFILIAGDVKAGYLIVDRIGMRVENIPHLFGSNQRPTGQRGIYGVLRTGADSIVDNAVRVLSIPTAS